MATSAAEFVSSAKQWLLIEVPRISCVSPSAGESQNSGDTFNIFVFKLFCTSLNYVQSQMSEYASLMTESCRS